jgi:hypothetical protein
MAVLTTGVSAELYKLYRDILKNKYAVDGVYPVLCKNGAAGYRGSLICCVENKNVFHYYRLKEQLK